MSQYSYCIPEPVVLHGPENAKSAYQTLDRQFPNQSEGQVKIHVKDQGFDRISDSFILVKSRDSLLETAIYVYRGDPKFSGDVPLFRFTETSYLFGKSYEMEENRAFFSPGLLGPGWKHINLRAFMPRREPEMGKNTAENHLDFLRDYAQLFGLETYAGQKASCYTVTTSVHPLTVTHSVHPPAATPSPAKK